MPVTFAATYPTLLDITRVAHCVGVGVGVAMHHTRRLVPHRTIPSFNGGGRPRFEPVEIDAWLDRWQRPQQSVS